MSGRRACALGALCALAGTAGDALLLWFGNAQRPELAWLPAPPAGALGLGTLAGAFAIPLYAVGYRGVSRALAEAAPAAAAWVFRCGAYGAALGGAFHAATGIASALEAEAGVGPGDPLAFVARHARTLAPLAGGVAALLAAGSILFAAAVARGGTRFPRAFALSSPMALVLAFVALGGTSELGRAFLVPAAPNVAHVVFFALASLAVHEAPPPADDLHRPAT